MIDIMRKANVLSQEDGTWTLAKSADLATISLGIPDSVHGIILARIDRLPDSHKPTIKVASVVGYSFELGLVAQVHPSQLVHDEILDQALTLERRDFIVPDWDAGITADSDTFKFREQATHEVSYGTLLFTQRRELHRNLAVVLEQQSPEVIDEIAYHAYLGEDWERTLRYHLLAGSQDKRLFANLQSIEHYRKALTGAEHLPASETVAQRLQIHTDLGELLITIGQYDQARDHLNAALQLATTTNNLEAQARACRWMARSHELQGAYEPALEWTNRGLTILGDRLTPSALELRLISGLIFLRLGDNERAGQQALASLMAAGELHELSIVARSHNLLGIIDRSRGILNKAAKHFEESLTLYREAGNLHGQALAENSLANVYFDMGQWTRADRSYREAGQIFSQLGNVYNRAMVDNNLGGIALNQGRLDDAIHFYQRALASLEQIGGSIWIMGALHLNLGATHIRRQEAVTGLDHLQASRELFDKAKNRDLLPELHRRLAEGYLALGRLETARDAAQQSIAIAEELTVIGEQGLASETMGRIVATMGQQEASEAILQEAIQLLEKVGDDYGLACAQLYLAEVYDRANKIGRRDELLDQCVPVLARLGASLELARAEILLTVAPA
jgi:tetratricopeptide (TPR) repeat protein